MAEERRQYSRIAFRAPARLVFPDYSLDAVVIDLSLKGALIRLPADARIEEDIPCTLHVRLGEFNDQISMDTRIAHVEGRYAGILCLAIDLDSVTHLRRLVELNLGSADLLERELSALVAE